ncbi:hypothetical protein MBUL_04491 (plasmid) [Methylobacterium bullatum]|uniref:KOW domain-containing protein n=1 Tax=Methylobacterium bullatum TaxID=570505 RepID=A0A679JF08_9HYPH|nr:hypothetical protein MBUL_04491 [Methylobacterium bullatum]
MSDATDFEDRRWFIAFTNPRRETTAAKIIRARSFQTYVPIMEVSRTVRRRRVNGGTPLFPRYVFVGLEEWQNLYGLRQTPLLEGIVKTAGVPVEVPTKILRGLHARELAGDFVFTDDREAAKRSAEAEAAAKKQREAFHALAPGAAVRVIDGPFKEFQGTVAETLEGDRMSIVINLFGSKHPVPIPFDHMEIVPRAPA